jgi:8-oxo-dGTP pyrophosphatase MutT (NUDIX family)
MHFSDYVSDKFEGAGFVFVTPDNMVLVLKKHNGNYSFAGGHREKKETPFETAKRECKEEIGFVPKGSIIDFIKYKKKETTNNCFSFIMKINKPFVPILSNEHKNYAWIPFEKISKMKLSKAVSDLVPRLKGKI